MYIVLFTISGDSYPDLSFEMYSPFGWQHGVIALNCKRWTIASRICVISQSGKLFLGLRHERDMKSLIHCNIMGSFVDDNQQTKYVPCLFPAVVVGNPGSLGTLWVQGCSAVWWLWYLLGWLMLSTVVVDSSCFPYICYLCFKQKLLALVQIS